MALIESELGKALASPVKRKVNKTQKLRAVARRVTASKIMFSSEVMVKVTGFGKGAGHVQAHLDYITRNGKIEMENDRGEVIAGKEDVKEFFKGWEGDFGEDKRRMNGKRHKEQRDTMHLVLSMPENTDPQAVKNGARAFAKDVFGKNHEYVFALHTDAPHPHCHVTVKCLGFDGKRLNPRKDDLQAWREGFAEQMRAQGVDAVATPRRARGVVKKAERNVIRHIEAGDKTHKPRESNVKKARLKEAAQELINEAKGAPSAPKPWDVAIEARQKEVRRAWLAAADAIEQEDNRITFNQKEAKNERPAYERISATQARPGQRAAAVYQSDLGNDGRQESPGTVASLRNVSGLRVVQHESGSKMLLRQNAPDRLGRRGSADHEMRRARTGDLGATSRSGREGGITGHEGITDENKALADRIRGFVAAMPPIETERRQIKRDLAQKFTKQPEKVHGVTPAPVAQPSTGQINGADISAPNRGEKDIER